MIQPRTWVITLPGTMTPETFTNLSVHDRKVLALGFRHAHEAVDVTKEGGRGISFAMGDKLYIIKEVKK